MVLLAVVLLLGVSGALVGAALAEGEDVPDNPAPLGGQQATPTPAASPTPKAKPAKTRAQATTRQTKTRSGRTPSPKPSETPMTDSERAAEAARCAQLANTDPIAAAECAEQFHPSPTPR